MDLVNTNSLRVSVRRYRPQYAERFTDFRWGKWKSRGHGKPRAETTWWADVLGIVVHVKWRPDGKRA